MTGQYKVISDNLGEYSVVSKDNVIVVTEIQHRITAETFCEELNILAEENEQLKCDETVNEINKIWSDNNELKQLNIPIEEIKETVTDYQGRITAIYYKE